jgi:uncharacterized protein (DUF305 family)
VRARRSTAVVALLLAFAAGACGGQDPATERVPAPRARAVTSSLDATARAFVELTIATDDQAVKLLDLGSSRAHDPALRSFAGTVAAARRTELATLHDILGSTPYVNNHAGHDMPGMPTEAELIALQAAPDFDGEFVRLVRNHLTESTTVARSGEGAVTESRTHAVAASMVRQRGEELAQLDAL